MAPPPATIAQIHERFPTVAFAGASDDRQFDSRQTTLREAVSCTGIGLHSGAELNMRLLPAAANTGIIFVRTDIADREEGTIPALFGSVCDVTLSTKIGNSHGHVVGTIEHLLAALAGLRVDNIIVEIDGPEVPIMDGSAQPFVDLVRGAGLVELEAARRALRVKKPVRVTQGDSYCELLPENGCVFEAEIDFQSSAIGRQAYQLDLMADKFDTHVAGARTFCMLHQVEAMHSAGLALGGSIENAILVDGDVVMNEEGLRSPQEFVQHKLLDAIGDLYLLGLPMIGHYRGYKSGHALHNKLLHALFLEADAFELVSLSDTDNILAAE